MLQYCFVLLLLFISMLLYFKVADRYNIVDRPNERSSHSEITLRGGGIIYWVVSFFYFLFNIKTNYLFFTGITLICVVSFYDDISNVSSKTRALIQCVALSFILIDLHAFELLPWYILLIIYIVSVGIINAYNFMDGINGITGLYTLSILGSLLYVNNCILSFSNNDFIIFPMLASVVFLFFNYRKKAKCFAGDVGSIAIAFWVIYLLLQLCMLTHTALWILLLAVYGIDTVGTILHRLYLKQNIFKAHRLHFYQILSNERKIDQRLVALLYAVGQALASFLVIYFYTTEINHISSALFVLSPLTLIYTLKFYFLKKY